MENLLSKSITGDKVLGTCFTRSLFTAPVRVEEKHDGIGKVEQAEEMIFRDFDHEFGPRSRGSTGRIGVSLVENSSLGDPECQRYKS